MSEAVHQFFIVTIKKKEKKEKNTEQWVGGISFGRCDIVCLFVFFWGGATAEYSPHSIVSLQDCPFTE